MLEGELHQALLQQVFVLDHDYRISQGSCLLVLGDLLVVHLQLFQYAHSLAKLAGVVDGVGAGLVPTPVGEGFLVLLLKYIVALLALKIIL